MTSRVAPLFLAVAFIASPVFAQGPPGAIPGGGAIQALTSSLTALTARVAKLEGNIVASDLAGTYSLVGLNTTMRAFHAGPPVDNATIDTSALRGSFTLNADGTGTASAVGACEGATLTEGSWTMQGFDCSEPAGDMTWNYADGVITITFSDGDEIPFDVALGGRFLIVAFAPFHASESSSNQVLLIATRLR